MNEWKAKIEAMKQQREAQSKPAGGSAITPSTRTASPSSSGSSLPSRTGPTSSSTSSLPTRSGSAITPSSTSRFGSPSSSTTTTTSSSTTTTSSFSRPGPSTTSTSSYSSPSSSSYSSPSSSPSSYSSSTSSPSSTTSSSTTTSPSGASSALERFRSKSASSPTIARPTTSTTPSSPSSSTSSTSTTSTSSSSSTSSSFSLPPLTGPVEAQFEQLKALYQAKSNECDQLKNKLMAGLPSVPATGSSSGAGGNSQIVLLEGKIKSLETKIASEVRQREMVEKRFEATKQELDDLKARREAARSRLQSKAGAGVTAAKARTAVAVAEAGVGRGGGATGASSSSTGPDRPVSKRSTRVMSKAPPVADIIKRILTEIARVEAAIKKAEDERQNAENELLEVACFKQAAEDRFSELTSLVEQIAVLVNNLQILIVTKCGSAPALKDPLSDLHSKIDSLVTRAGQLAKGAAATSTAQVAAVAAAVGAPPPPPPPGVILSSPLPVSSSSNSNARASTIMSQIRKGTTLKSFDAGAIKKEREEKAKNARQSVSILSALQDTLRTALASRHDDMNPDSDDDTWAGDY